MNNLGLNQLTDEQLLELQNELLYEIMQRDAYLRNLTQNAIYTYGKALKDIRVWYEELIERHRREQKQILKEETARYFQEWVKDKCILTAAEEREEIDAGFKAGRLQVATSALLNQSTPLAKRLTAAFAFNKIVYLSRCESATMQTVVATVEVDAEHATPNIYKLAVILQLDKPLYGRFQATLSGGVSRPPNPQGYMPNLHSGSWKESIADLNALVHSAPVDVLESLLIEYAENPGYPDRIRVDPIMWPPEPLAETPDPPPTLDIHCQDCRGLTVFCPRCKGTYCRNCEYCRHCGYTLIGRNTHE